MFRAVLHHLPRASRSLTVKHRNFVSTVLLSRTWEQETVVTLRQEAKNRGLSTKGNKPILINRIQDYEESRLVSSQSVTLEIPAASRNASSSATAPQATPPGIPLASQCASASVPGFFSVKLPDLSEDGPDAPVQAPFLPDFWDSSRLKPEPTEPSHPKLHVVSGSATHPDGGPTYNLEKPIEVDEIEQATSEKPSESADEHGFFRDLADDLGLPRTSSVGQAVSNTVKEQGPEMHIKSRPLNNEQSKGVWVLLGLLAGSWIIGGWVNRAPPAHEVQGVEEDKH